MNTKEIIDLLPYTKPFLFIDELLQVDSSGAEGVFTFDGKMDFFKGHFKGNPITPGVLLTECCAQIGLVCLGIYLLKGQQDTQGIKIGMSSSQMEFLKPVLPNETVRVISKKIYFRFHKLKCDVRMYDSKGELVCNGTLAGMLISDINE